MEAVGLRDVEPGDLAAIGTLYRHLFSVDPDRRAHWLADAPVPALVRRVAVAGDTGRIVAHLAEVGMGTWVAGRKRVVSTGMHWIVDPEFRGAGIGQMLFSEARAYRAIDAMLGFPSHLGAQKMAGSGHHTLLPPLEQWFSWRHPEALADPRFERLPPGVRRAALAGVAAAARAGRGIGLQIDEQLPPDADLDELAARSAAFAPCIRIRDAGFVRWRWLALGAARLAAARDRRGALRGWVVYRGTTTGQGGSIMDVLADSPAVMRALLSFAGDRVSDLGGHLVDLRFRDPRRWARAAAIGAGFLHRGDDWAVVVRSLVPNVREAVSQPDAWYLTAADTDVP
jgi:hypothetical protein